MDSDVIAWLVPGGFLLLFIPLWIGVCHFLLVMSGWPRLAERFPDRADTVLKTFRFQSGSMGNLPLGGVNYSSCLTISVCATGLRIRLWKIFAPFSGPVFVPWSAIEVRHRSLLVFSKYDLIFGSPPSGNLMITHWAGRRYAAHAKGNLKLPA